MKTLIIFARAPIAGQVKTRLARCPALGEEGALKLYRAFLEDTFTMAVRTSAETVNVSFTPDDQEEAMRGILESLCLGRKNERRFTFSPQKGDSFSRRVANAFRHAERFGGEDLVIIGADAPLLKPDMVDRAFDFIHENSGIVLGPSGEGGMYLIGMEAGSPVDFAQVFGAGSEFENMLNQAMTGNIPLAVLAETLDVDVEADLVGLLGLARAMEYQRRTDKDMYAPERTIKAINEMRLAVEREAGGTRDKRVVIADE